MGITSARLLELGLVDRVIDEPLGGAHRAPETMAESLRSVLEEELTTLTEMPTASLLEARSARLRSLGRYREA